ncbi:hypothetical protein [Rhodococcus sp. (in: high G+C Gram-positive bacteria)]|uniref:hypothetical protein n=1 Tax=Rhodococcus sp. TaxID=1831 RepID=UPI001A33A13F|nr:hypothetical protein [Rhodococcus sp. (in: high G+C Gram-positive bacteria)]MBJ7481763.1 hypothetical protein [Rhodococcus sp. (in: high G+C Gram-positive bacteria)]
MSANHIEALAKALYENGNPQHTAADRAMLGPFEELDALQQTIWIDLANAAQNHIGRRITELEDELAEVTDKWGLISHHYRKAEAAIARVENALPEASTGFNPTLSEYDRGYERGQQVAVQYVQSAIKGDDSPAALEGE